MASGEGGFGIVLVEFHGAFLGFDFESVTRGGGRFGVAHGDSVTRNVKSLPSLVFVTLNRPADDLVQRLSSQIPLELSLIPIALQRWQNHTLQEAGKCGPGGGASVIVATLGSGSPPISVPPSLGSRTGSPRRTASTTRRPASISAGGIGGGGGGASGSMPMRSRSDRAMSAARTVTGVDGRGPSTALA